MKIYINKQTGSMELKLFTCPDCDSDLSLTSDRLSEPITENMDLTPNDFYLVCYDCNKKFDFEIKLTPRNNKIHTIKLKGHFFTGEGYYNAT